MSAPKQYDELTPEQKLQAQALLESRGADLGCHAYVYWVSDVSGNVVDFQCNVQ